MTQDMERADAMRSQMRGSILNSVVSTVIEGNLPFAGERQRNGDVTYRLSAEGFLNIAAPSLDPDELHKWNLEVKLSLGQSVQVLLDGRQLGLVIPMLAISNSTEDDGTIACNGAGVIVPGAISLLPAGLSLRIGGSSNCGRFAARGISLEDADIEAAVAKTAQQKDAQREAAVLEHCQAAISKMVTRGELEGIAPSARQASARLLP